VHHPRQSLRLLRLLAVIACLIHEQKNAKSQLAIPLLIVTGERRTLKNHRGGGQVARPPRCEFRVRADQPHPGGAAALHAELGPYPR
jgi:hypothetical protein